MGTPVCTYSLVPYLMAENGNDVGCSGPQEGSQRPKLSSVKSVHDKNIFHTPKLSTVKSEDSELNTGGCLQHVLCTRAAPVQQHQPVCKESTKKLKSAN